MKKKFLSAILFGALLATSTGTFVSCKDYDDDIKDLQVQIDKKASADDLTSKVNALQASVTSASSEAASAVTTAKEALEKASAAATPEEITALKKAVADAETKYATIETVDAKVKTVSDEVAALKKQIEASANQGLTAAQQKAIDGKIAAATSKVDNVSAEVAKLIGHRLTSLSVITTEHINGIAAITLTSLQYTPQTYKAYPTHDVMYKTDHASRPAMDHVGVTNAKEVYISTEHNKAYFHVSPNMGVRNQDITMPSFESITSTNVTRAEEMVKVNTPIQPTAYNINKDVLEVQYKKTVTGKITTTGSAHAGGKETFTMVSLKAPIAKANLAKGESAAAVNSEYVRVEEYFKAPYIANAKHSFKKNAGNLFADEVEATTDPEVGKDGVFVHYHDSICAYESEVDRYVDIKADYSKELDLKKYVTVCVNDVNVAKNHANHEKLANYADYGLGYKFYMAKAPYITLGGPEGNSNKTDQQQFAKVTKDGIMTSKVYTIDGNSATAVGREPLVRAELWDLVNNHLIAIRYIKVKWVKEVGETKLAYEFPGSLYECNDFVSIIGTKEMNEQIYDKAKEGGMTKAEFHATYLDAGFDPNNAANWGKVELVKNTEGDVESYNIKWTITHADIVKKYPNWNTWNNSKPMEFTKTFFWKSGTNNTLVITVTKKIYKPEFALWGYDGRYWRTGTATEWSVFNVNPIVYNTKEANPAWATNTKNNPTCNIYTDLLNGFLDDMGKKPNTGADGALYYTVSQNLKNGKFMYMPNNKYYYAADYQNVTKGFKGVDRTKNTYTAFAKEGVRFAFDEAKLKNGADYVYTYYNASKGKTEQLRATVKDNDTMTPKLYINNELAATIVNFVVNNLNPNPSGIANEMTYNIKLEEKNPTHAPWSGDVPTEAAKALVGELIPINLVADLCNDTSTHPAIAKNAHLIVVKSYDAFIIEPIKTKEPGTDHFTDALIEGSTITVANANIYDSWNADAKGKYYPVISPKNDPATLAGLKKKLGSSYNLALDLGNFYEATAAEWPVDASGKITKMYTNLKLTDGNLIPTEGYKEGPMPSSTEVVYDASMQTLTYHNYSGTPVNWNYKIYIPVTYGYKWKTQVKYLEIDVYKNQGTGDNQGK